MGSIASARRVAAAIAACCACSGTWAAGGHHAVDDATILGRGDCEQENWYSRAPSGERLLHAGVNCRVGPVELAGAAEAAREDGRSATQWNVEVKWAREVADGFSVGLDLQPTWVTHRSPRYAATRFAALATWAPSVQWALHANAGRHFLHGEKDLPNGGVAVEWMPVPRWSLVLERYLELETHLVRAGARWAAGRVWTVDLSYAKKLGGPIPSFWTLGLSFDLDD